MTKKLLVWKRVGSTYSLEYIEKTGIFIQLGEILRIREGRYVVSRILGKLQDNSEENIYKTLKEAKEVTSNEVLRHLVVIMGSLKI